MAQLPGGLFVTFEGGEGSGKSTQIARLAEHLRLGGRDPVITREPGGTPLAEGIRALLLDPARPPAPLAEALLMEAARAELVTHLIRPALAQGRVVLCDRYADSTLVYQGAGRGLDVAMLRRLNETATGGLVPDLTILLDLDHAAGLARRTAAGGANRLDQEPEAFHARVRAAYVALAEAEPGRWMKLDATLAPETLAVRIAQAVEARLTR